MPTAPSIALRNDRALLHRVLRAVVIASALGVVLLGVAVHLSPVLGPDVRLTQELQRDGVLRLLGPLLAAVSALGIPWVAATSVGAAAAVFFALHLRREAMFTFAVVGADAANYAVKLLVDRPRPSDQFAVVMQTLSDPSFPSGHVVHYVVFFGFLYAAALEVWQPRGMVRAALGASLAALLVLVSVSRVYLGAHWTTDVLGGYLMGSLMLLATLHLYLRGKALTLAPTSATS